MTRTRILLFLVSLVLVPTLSYFVILYARGYRFFRTTTPQIVTPTGLLAANSNPDGAQLYVNGSLKTATASTLSLSPGSYLVEIKKDGFATWKKQLTIEAEIVTRAWATLFPTVPSLRAITFSGAGNPILSPDGSKIVYTTAEKNLTKISSIDLSESPLNGLNRESRLLATLNNLGSTPLSFTWSPDSHQILIIATPSAYLIDTTNQKFTQTTTAEQILDTWAQQHKLSEDQKFATLPPTLQDILATSSSQLIWSPKETKLMYTATASASLPDNLLEKPLPGSSTQPQARTLAPNSLYVYDLEEDRNFLIQAPVTSTFSWFPTSTHLVQLDANKITILEYDNQNPVVVYAGPLAAKFAAPYSSGRQLAILTNLNPTGSILANLYALSLK
jgi:hypothetical protein